MNWFGNKPVGIDFETTGLTAGWNEIIQVAIVPLDDNLVQDGDPFYEYIRPQHPERQSPEAAAVHGIDVETLDAEPAEVVAGWLQSWFESFNLGLGRKLIPIAHNWAFESAYLDHWLGGAHKESIFHYHARDTQCACAFLRDKGVPVFSEMASVSLGYICETLGIMNERPHDALHDAMACAELYRRLCA